MEEKNKRKKFLIGIKIKRNEEVYKEKMERELKLLDFEDENLIREKDTIENLEIEKIFFEDETFIKNAKEVRGIFKVVLETTDKEIKKIIYKPILYKSYFADVWNFEYIDGAPTSKVSYDVLPYTFKEIEERLKEGKTVNIRIPIITYKKVTDKGEKRYYALNRNEIKKFMINE